MIKTNADDTSITQTINEINDKIINNIAIDKNYENVTSTSESLDTTPKKIKNNSKFTNISNTKKPIIKIINKPTTKFVCSLCDNKSFTRKTNFQEYSRSDGHIRKLMASLEAKPNFCQPCDMQLSTATLMFEHLKSNNHFSK